ncbi:hypothetical protein RI367_008758 [Sorochytrium milnesiophthora]
MLYELLRHDHNLVMSPVTFSRLLRSSVIHSRKPASQTGAFCRGIAFTDESRFTVFGNDECSRVGRRIDTATTVAILLAVKRGGGSVMVWGAMTGFGIGSLIVLNGTPLKKDTLIAPPPMPGLGHRGTGNRRSWSGVPLPDTGLPNPHPDALDDTPPDLNSGSPYAVPIDPSSLQKGLVPKDHVQGADPTCQAPVQNGKPFFSLAPNGTMQQCVCTPQTIKPAALSSSGLCGPPTWSVDVKHKAKCQTWVFEGPENPDTLETVHQKSIFGYGPPNPAGRPWKDCAQGYQLTSVIKQGAPYTLIFEPSYRPTIPGAGSYYSYASVKRQVLNDTAPPPGVPLCNFDTVQVSNNQDVFKPNWVKSGVSMETLSDWTPFEATWNWNTSPAFSRISIQFQFQHSQPTDCWENSIVWLRYYMVCSTSTLQGPTS